VLQVYSFRATSNYVENVLRQEREETGEGTREEGATLCRVKAERDAAWERVAGLEAEVARLHGEELESCTDEELYYLSKTIDQASMRVAHVRRMRGCDKRLQRRRREYAKTISASEYGKTASGGSSPCRAVLGNVTKVALQQTVAARSPASDGRRPGDRRRRRLSSAALSGVKRRLCVDSDCDIVEGAAPPSEGRSADVPHSRVGERGTEGVSA
jgi:hypothetical protein